MTIFPVSDLVSAGVLGGLFLALIGAAELWSRRGHAKPEWTRKLVHLGGGLLCLFFPWIFASPWTVLAMALLLSAFIAVGGRTGLLKSLHGVSRRTRGSEYYPLSIFMVYLLSSGAPWIYVCSVLVLAVGDAFAALIGSKYGVHRYEVESEHKSLEGSLVFLGIAFAAIFIPMVGMTDLPPATGVLAALLVAVLVTGFEAISLSGTDNLFVPLGVCVIIPKITSKAAPEIAYQIISLAVIVVLIALLVRRAKSFNVGGTIAFALFAYGTWSLGSELWALPVFLGFSAYMALWWVWLPGEGHRRSVKVRTIFEAVMIPLVILVTGNMSGWAALLYGPFIASLSAVLAFSAWNHCIFFRRPPAGLRPALAAMTGGLAAVAVALGPWLLKPAAPLSVLVAVAAVTVAAAVINDRVMGASPDLSPGAVWSASRIALTAACAGAVLALQAAGAMAPWG